MAPRPILKSLPEPDLSLSTSNPFPFASSTCLLDSPHVHFPPTPTLTSTEITHSPFTYDRAPIVVTPNTCALPERGERKYFSSISATSDSGTSKRKPKGDYFDPRAYEAVEHESSSTSSSSSQPLPPSLLFSNFAMSGYESPLQAPPSTVNNRLSSESNTSFFVNSESPRLGRQPQSMSISSYPGSSTTTASSSPASFTSVSLSSSTASIPTYPSSNGSLYPYLPISSSSASSASGNGPHGSSRSKHPSSSTSFSQCKNESMVSSCGVKATKKRKNKEGDGFYRTRKLLNSSCTPSSGFYEPGLDGCLGGF